MPSTAILAYGYDLTPGGGLTADLARIRLLEADRSDQGQPPYGRDNNLSDREAIATALQELGLLIWEHGAERWSGRWILASVWYEASGENPTWLDHNFSSADYRQRTTLKWAIKVLDIRLDYSDRDPAWMLASRPFT